MLMTTIKYNALTAKRLIKGFWYYTMRSTYVFQRHSELTAKQNVDLKALQQRCILEPEFYCALVYKFRVPFGTCIILEQYKKTVNRY